MTRTLRCTGEAGGAEDGCVGRVSVHDEVRFGPRAERTLRVRHGATPLTRPAGRIDVWN